MRNRNLRLTWNASYALKECLNPIECVVLLHGWQQRGDIMLHILEGLFGPRTLVLAPNGPYPAPFPGKRGLRPAYSWYFFDPQTDEYLVPMDFSLQYLKTLIQDLGYEHLPKRIIGFSQGGYLAPFCGLHLEEVRQVLLINSRYRSEALDLMPFRIDAIHSLDDPAIDYNRAKACHLELLERGNSGMFRTVEKAGHMLNEALVRAAGDLLAQGDPRHTSHA